MNYISAIAEKEQGKKAKEDYKSALESATKSQEDYRKSLDVFHGKLLQQNIGWEERWRDVVSQSDALLKDLTENESLSVILENDDTKEYLKILLGKMLEISNENCYQDNSYNLRKKVRDNLCKICKQLIALQPEEGRQQLKGLEKGVKALQGLEKKENNLPEKNKVSIKEGIASAVENAMRFEFSKEIMTGERELFEGPLKDEFDIYQALRHQLNQAKVSGYLGGGNEEARKELCKHLKQAGNKFLEMKHVASQVEDNPADVQLKNKLASKKTEFYGCLVKINNATENTIQKNSFLKFCRYVKRKVMSWFSAKSAALYNLEKIGHDSRNAKASGITLRKNSGMFFSTGLLEERRIKGLDAEARADKKPGL